MKKFRTDKNESTRSMLKRILFNFFPAYRRTGGRIAFISGDWKEVHVRLRLKWSTRNYVGTVFGGSIYGALDPIYMIQLITLLGDRYVVWDKSATIKFIRPVRKEVFARFLITDQLLAEIKKKIEVDGEKEMELPVQFVDKNEVIHALVVKKIYIADKGVYKAKAKS